MRADRHSPAPSRRRERPSAVGRTGLPPPGATRVDTVGLPCVAAGRAAETAGRCTALLGVLHGWAADATGGAAALARPRRPTPSTPSTPCSINASSVSSLELSHPSDAAFALVPSAPSVTSPCVSISPCSAASAASPETPSTDPHMSVSIISTTDSRSFTSSSTDSYGRTCAAKACCCSTVSAPSRAQSSTSKAASMSAGSATSWYTAFSPGAPSAKPPQCQC